MSAAGLGLQLYDGLLGTSVNEAFLEWIGYARKHYMGRDRKGRIDWVAFYYDPIENPTMTFPGPVNGYSALCLLHYLYPTEPELGLELYESAMRQLGWNNPNVPVVQLADDPQMLSTAMWMAREVGDPTTWDRLRSVSESQFEPRTSAKTTAGSPSGWASDALATGPDQRDDDDDRVRARRVVTSVPRAQQGDA